MPEAVWGFFGVIVGGLLALGGQVVAARMAAASDRAKWKRTRRADEVAALEQTYLALLQHVQALDRAVSGWESLGKTRAWAQIDNRCNGLDAVSHVIMLREGPKDPAIALIADLGNAAKAYEELNLVGRVPAPTESIKQSQANQVRAAGDQLRTYLHTALQNAQSETA